MKKIFMYSMVLLLATILSTNSMEAQNRKTKTSAKAKTTRTTSKKQSTTAQGATTSNGQTFTVKGVKFKMIPVDGASFSIGMTEVTQALWTAVMGNNPSKFKGANRPVEQVSWNDCHQFIEKLNQLTGRKFRLPNVTEWEIAARGGSNKNEYSYSGSHYIDKIAWYKANSGNTTHDVAMKQPNQLGIYDMTGNVWEWCDDDEATAKLQMGYSHLTRGGCFVNEENVCLITVKSKTYPNERKSGVGFRLAMDIEKQKDIEKPKSSKLSTSPNIQTFNVGGVEFNMIKVTGEVEGVSYYIGMTEVTQALWEAVMHNNPSYFKGDNLPVEQVTLVKCDDFIKELNRLTGKKFYFPSQNEWLYAAFGGKKKNDYSYSGSNLIGSVAWFKGNSDNSPHEVATKQPNQLGIYDMTGNVKEFCLNKKRSNGELSYSYVIIGGSWEDNDNDCLFTEVIPVNSPVKSSAVGFRLAMVDE